MGEKIQQILQFTTSLKENKKYSCTYKNSYKLHQIFLVFVWLPNNQEKKKSQNKASIFFFFFLATPRGMWDLSFSTRDRTCVLCIGSRRLLTTGPPG